MLRDADVQSVVTMKTLLPVLSGLPGMAEAAERTFDYRAEQDEFKPVGLIQCMSASCSIISLNVPLRPLIGWSITRLVG
jgi:hypothetical protein